MLEVLFNIPLSRWEQKVLSAAFLSGVDIREGMFPADAVERMSSAMEKLHALPKRWSRELSLHVLFEEE